MNIAKFTSTCGHSGYAMSKRLASKFNTRPCADCQHKTYLATLSADEVQRLATPTEIR